MNAVTIFGLKPSQIIQIALDALAEAEQPDSPVKPKMYIYHQFDSNNGLCFACLGGLAAIKHFDIPLEALRNWMTTTTSLNKEYPKLDRFEVALDAVREGKLSLAFQEWGLNNLEGDPFNRAMIPYCNGMNSEEFKQDLTQLINDLTSAGY